jgi:hypothetical protein
MKYLLQKLTEKTTWLGILNALSAMGVVMTEGTIQAIAGAGVGVITLILVFMNEKK